MESSQKTFRCPWKCCQRSILKVVVEHTISAAESPGLPKGQGTADKCVLTQDMPGELGRPGEIPICMQASQHASKAVTAWYLFSSDGDRSHVLR